MAEIKKIEIEVGGKKIELTLAEAKELQEVLDQLMGTGQKQVPFIVERHLWEPRPWWRDWQVTYGPSSISLCASSAGDCAG